MDRKSLSKEKSKNTIETILNEFELKEIIPQLSPNVLKKLIHHIGLEDSGAVINAISDNQFLDVLDLDLWKNFSLGKGEEFDPCRFLIWIEILLEQGELFCAKKLILLGTEYLSTCLSYFVFVLNRDESFLQMDILQLGWYKDKYLLSVIENLENNHRIGDYVFYGKDEGGWDIIIAALECLVKEDFRFFEVLTYELYQQTMSNLSDSEDLSSIMDKKEQAQDDFHEAYELRIKEKGFISSMDSFYYLNYTKKLNFKEQDLEPNAHRISKSYFNHFNFKGSIKKKTTIPNNNTDVQDEIKMKVSLIEGFFQEKLTLHTPLIAKNSLSLERKIQNNFIEQVFKHIQNYPEHQNQIHMELNFLALVLKQGAGLEEENRSQSEIFKLVLSICQIGYELKAYPSFENHRPKIESFFQLGLSCIYQRVSVLAYEILIKLLRGHLRKKILPRDDHAQWINEEIQVILSKIQIKHQNFHSWTDIKSLDFLEIIMDSKNLFAFKSFIKPIPQIPNFVKQSEYSCNESNKLSSFECLRDIDHANKFLNSIKL